MNKDTTNFQVFCGGGGSRDLHLNPVNLDKRRENSVTRVHGRKEGKGERGSESYREGKLRVRDLPTYFQKQ